MPGPVSAERFRDIAEELFVAMYKGNEGEPWANQGWGMQLATGGTAIVHIDRNSDDERIAALLKRVASEGFDGIAVGLELTKIGSRSDIEQTLAGGVQLGVARTAGMPASALAERELDGPETIFVIHVSTATGIRETIAYEVVPKGDKRFLGERLDFPQMDTPLLGIFDAAASPLKP